MSHLKSNACHGCIRALTSTVSLSPWAAAIAVIRVAFIWPLELSKQTFCFFVKENPY